VTDVDEFVIARNPDESSSLPYLLRIPLASGAVVLKAKDTWPRTNKIYCHPADAWPSPDEVDIVERVPTARASGHELHVLVDTRERYAWKFSEQQTTASKQALPVGDYAVEVDGQVVAVVERKSVDDLVSTIVGGKLWMLLAELAAFATDASGSGSGRVAAIVVEDRYSAIFKLRHVRPASIATQLAEAAVRYPSVPIVFAETRQLAQEWTFRFFGAAVEHVTHERVGEERAAQLVPAGSVPHRAPRPAEVRIWAAAQGLHVSDRGRIAADVMRSYLDAHGPTR